MRKILKITPVSLCYLFYKSSTVGVFQLEQMLLDITAPLPSTQARLQKIKIQCSSLALDPKPWHSWHLKTERACTVPPSQFKNCLISFAAVILLQAAEMLTRSIFNSKLLFNSSEQRSALVGKEVTVHQVRVLAVVTTTVTVQPSLEKVKYRTVKSTDLICVKLLSNCNLH